MSHVVAQAEQLYRDHSEARSFSALDSTAAARRRYDSSGMALSLSLSNQSGRLANQQLTTATPALIMDGPVADVADRGFVSPDEQPAKYSTREAERAMKRIQASRRRWRQRRRLDREPNHERTAARSSLSRRSPLQLLTIQLLSYAITLDNCPPAYSSIRAKR